MTVKMGGPMPPMGGMPMNNPMMPRQPMNPLPPPMPVPLINQPMPMQQGAAPVPVNARRRKRFGDSLETMLSRPPMVASDQMANMNVFTGQMMNTAARPPVVQMRGGGIVRNMRRGGTSMADYSGPSFAAAQSAASRRNPGRTGSMTHDQLMASIRGGSSPNDDKPVVTAPVVPMNFGDDEDYTPTSAELNQQLLDMGAPDKRFDVVPNAIKNIYGGMGDLDDRDDQTSTLNAINASIAAANRRAAGDFGDVEMAPGTGGIAAIRSRQPAPNELTFDPFNNTPSIPSVPVGSGMNPANVYIDPLDPFGGPGPDISISPPDPRSYVGSGMNPLTAYGPTSPDAFIGTGPDISAPKNYVGSGANPLTAYGPTSSDAFLGTGDPLDLGIGTPEKVYSGRGSGQAVTGGGQTGTGTGGGEEQDDRSIVQKFLDDVKAVPGNIMRDIQMGIAAGFYGNYDEARANLEKALNPDGTRKYSDADITSWINRTKETVENNKRQTQGQSTDDDSPMSTSPVDPCPAGMRLDPVAGICVPVEEAEEEGPSLDLNRTRDDEFNELDDIMKRIVKPVGERDDVRTMQAGGSVGLNRVADNFLAAMGG